MASQFTRWDNWVLNCLLSSLSCHNGLWETPEIAFVSRCYSTCLLCNRCTCCTQDSRWISRLSRPGGITRDNPVFADVFLLWDPIEDFVASAIQNEAGGVDARNPHALCLDELTRNDWDKLRSILNILEPFQVWSLRLQGKRKNSSLYEIFPAMDELLSVKGMKR